MNLAFQNAPKLFRRRALLTSSIGFLVMLACGCNKKVEEEKAGATIDFLSGTDITDAGYGKGFSLPDANGRIRTLQDFKGRAVLVFFGFVQCPDVCPTTMMEMAQLKSALGKDAEKLQVIFITVDPERDTPDVLKAYVSAFDESFIALLPQPHELAKLAREFRVFYKKIPVGGTEDQTQQQSPDAAPVANYTMDHTAGCYVFDPQGKLRLLTRYGASTESLVKDIRMLLGQ